MPDTIKVFYKCRECGLSHHVTATARNPDEDVKDWVMRVRRLAQFDHTYCAPACPSITLDVAIPINKEGEGQGFIGEKPVRPVPDEPPDFIQ